MGEVAWLGCPSLGGVRRVSTLEHGSACEVRTGQDEEDIHTELPLGMQYQSPSRVRRMSMMTGRLIQDVRS